MDLKTYSLFLQNQYNELNSKSNLKGVFFSAFSMYQWQFTVDGPNEVKKKIIQCI